MNRFADAGDYARDLIRRDQDASGALIEMLEAGAASGLSSRSLDEIWEGVKLERGDG